MVTTRPRPHLTLEVPPDVRELAGVRDSLREWLADHDVPPPIQEDLALVVTELCTNAIEAATDAPVAVGATIDDLTVCLEVSNEPGSNDRPAFQGLAHDPLQERGRGLAIVHALSDDVTMSTTQGRTVVRALRRL